MALANNGKQMLKENSVFLFCGAGLAADRGGGRPLATVVAWRSGQAARHRPRATLPGPRPT